VAVVSISRIQIRRGRKQAGSGLPQLASGELGWAVDTQELYIGNGAVSEGAPYVGNTKLLSEHDDLFQFADAYAYKSTTGYLQTGTSINSPVLRTLQDRLDDRVSVKAFGANGDGLNQTVAIQRAIDQLYLNAANKGQSQSRVELIFEPGEYLITSTIYLPPFVTIRGAGAAKTIILSGAFEAFKTVNETSTVGNYASDAVSTTLNQARNIKVSDLTIRSTGGTALTLQSCRDSEFRNLILEGSYNIGDFAAGIIDGIRLNSLSTAVSSNNNLFDNVKVRNFVTAVKSDNDIADNRWNNCEFKTMYQGFALGLTTVIGTSGQLTGPIRNKISNSTFDDIMTYGIYVKVGTDNVSDSNKYYNVGNDGGTAANNINPVIRFDQPGGVSTNDYFERAEQLGYDANFLINIPYTTEVFGPQITQINRSHVIELGQYSEATRLFKLPASTARGYEIDYQYRSSQVDAVRNGKLNLVVDPNNSTQNLTDEYDYTGDVLYQENLRFFAQLSDENGDTVVDTVAIMVLNFTSSDQAELIYTVKYKT
jgi:hypothetical protein